MNERIKEFAKQSGLVTRYGKSVNVATGEESLDTYFNLAPKMSELEKFTKLVIQECATIINAIPTAPQGAWSDGYYEGCSDSAKAIQEHFGLGQ